MSEIKKVVLAYSGGLDTSIIIPWLKEHYNNCEVIAVCGNVGQKSELEGLEERAKASGASKLYVEDLTDEFVEDYVIPTMQAGADYEGYLLGTSFARPILAKRVVEIARAEGADAVCHGSTGDVYKRHALRDDLLQMQLHDLTAGQCILCHGLGQECNAQDVYKRQVQSWCPADSPRNRPRPAWWG